MQFDPARSRAPAIESRVAGVMAKEGLSHGEAVRAFLASRQPTGRFVSMESVAALAAFLCGPDGGDITGAALPIDGAWSAA